MAYEQNPCLEQYTGFVIGVEGFTVTITRADISPEYIKSIRAGHVVSENLNVQRSQQYDISDPGIRREFMRVLIGLDRFFCERPEFSFPLKHVRPGDF